MDPDTNSNPLFTSFRSIFSSQPIADGENNGVASAASGNHSENVPQLTPGITTQQSADIEMGNAEYDDMPELQDISDSSDSGAEIESARQANEEEMQSVEQNGATAPLQPQISSFLRTTSTSGIADSSATPVRQNSNRRPRVDDDDDEERDRRHPSQRVSRANDNTASSSSASQTLPSVSLPHNQPHTHASTPTSGIFGAPQPPVQRQPSNIQRHVFHTTINLGTGEPGNNPFRLFQHLLPTPGANPLNNNDDHNPIPNVNAQNNIDAAAPENPQEPTPQIQPAQPQPGNAGPRPPPRVFGGMFSFDLGPAGLFLPIPAGAAAPPNSTQTGPNGNAIPNAQPPPQPHHAQLPTHVAELLARIGAQVLGGNLAGLGYGLDNQEDPDRARKLVDGLEVVPEGLVRRLERVGGSGGGMGEEPTSGGDSGCAICWDRLLDTDGQSFGPSEESHPKGESEESMESSSDAEKKQPKIVSLPCTHVFHAECLIPWFSRPRQTTCPTCRFNIDPDNLTYVSWHTRQREGRATAAAQTENAPPAEGAPVPDATADAQGYNAEAEARANDREAIFRQLSAFYGNPDRPTTPPPPQLGRQEQPDDQFHAPHGITVTSIPITIPIPVAIPSTGINPDQLTQNRSGSDARTALNTPNAAGGTNAEQSRPQSAPGVAGPPQDILQDPTSRATGSIPPTPGDRFTAAFDPASHFLPRQPNGNQPGTNAFNLGGLDFGIPGMRADVVVTMDFFDPRGPIRHHTHDGDHPHDDAHQHVAGDRSAEGEDIPEIDDEESDGEDADFRDEMLRMFSMGRGSNFADDPFLPNQPRQTPQPGQTPPTAEQQQQPHQQQQQQQRPHTHGPTNLGPGIHFAAGSGRSMGEAFAQLLSRMSAANPQNQQEQQGEHAPAEDGNQTAEGQFQAEGAVPQQPRQAEGPADAPPQPQARPRAFNRHFPPPTGLFANGFPAFGGAPLGGMGPYAHHAPRPKPAWSLPPAPGPTLRQRIERREREAGLRCYDVSCGLGPSDEDPFTDKVSETVSAMKQLAIKKENDVEVCEHRFHSACLVSAERVALRGADAVVQEGRVGVLCPVCRSTGCVTKEEWDEGVVALK